MAPQFSPVDLFRPSVTDQTRVRIEPKPSRPADDRFQTHLDEISEPRSDPQPRPVDGSDRPHDRIKGEAVEDQAEPSDAKKDTEPRPGPVEPDGAGPTIPPLRAQNVTPIPIPVGAVQTPANEPKQPPASAADGANGKSLNPTITTPRPVAPAAADGSKPNAAVPANVGASVVRAAPPSERPQTVNPSAPLTTTSNAPSSKAGTPEAVPSLPQPDAQPTVADKPAVSTSTVPAEASDVRDQDAALKRAADPKPALIPSEQNPGLKQLPAEHTATAAAHSETTAKQAAGKPALPEDGRPGELSKRDIRLSRSEQPQTVSPPGAQSRTGQRQSVAPGEAARIRGGNGDPAASSIGRFLVDGIRDALANSTGNAARFDSLSDTTTSNLGPSANVSVRPTGATTTSFPLTHGAAHGDTVGQLLTSGGPQGDPVEAAARVLSASVRGGRHQVTLQLEPPELGQLRLEVRMHQQAMTLRVDAETQAVARLIESRLPELHDLLATHGIKVEKSSIVVRPPASAETGFQQQGSGDGSQHSPSSMGHHSPAGAGYDGSHGDGSAHASYRDPSQAGAHQNDPGNDGRRDDLWSRTDSVAPDGNARSWLTESSLNLVA